MKSIAFCLVVLSTSLACADPCGMVPPIYPGGKVPLVRTGLQETYVFYKDGVESFAIRPGYTGKVDEFGMLIPFPNPPAIRKVSDAAFEHLAAAVDPPEVVVNLLPQLQFAQQKANFNTTTRLSFNAPVSRSEVRVIRKEAVGMYEVVVLEAGSAAALSKWMKQHEYVYPEGMDKVCNEYVEDGWCFVAVKTRVGDKGKADPRPGQREANDRLPAGSTFDGNVQAMAFRFESEELVVPMRLSAFNEGDLRNIVYLLTDSPKKIRAIPEEYVMRQIPGDKLFSNVTQPLPVRIIGGSEKDIPEYRRKSLPAERNPTPHNGVARDMFAADLLAVASKELSLPEEENEKVLLRIGERFGLRGVEIDKLHEAAIKSQREKTVAKAIADVKEMTLTVVDGDFPREVIASRNLAFAEYSMPARRNSPRLYNVRTKQASGDQPGILHTGALDFKSKAIQPEVQSRFSYLYSLIGLGIFFSMLAGLVFYRRLH